MMITEYAVANSELLVSYRWLTQAPNAFVHIHVSLQ